MLLGVTAVKNWATLLAMADIDDKPDELIVTALVRAKMCELAAAQRPAREREEYFTTGLFSVVDALLDSPMDVVLASLPLADEIRDALHHRLGPKGVVLNAVLSYEHADFEGLRGPRSSWRVRPGDLHVGDRLGPRGSARAGGFRLRRSRAYALSLRPLENRY